VLEDFLKLDDHDIMGAVKVWATHSDRVLARLATDLVERRTLRIRLRETPWEEERVQRIKREVARHLKIGLDEADHFVLTGGIVNNAYDSGKDRIELLYRNGRIEDIATASDTFNIQALSRPVEKFHLAYPRWLGKEWAE
jgi:hypothetical protein